MRIYVASSWRNALQPDVVAALRAEGHEVYDFRNPAPGDHGFAWSAIDPEWQTWTPGAFRAALDHPVAAAGFARDMAALRAADACVLVLPCGRSAHLELGWAAGAAKRTFVLLADGCEPELMYRMHDGLCTSLAELCARLDTEPRAPGCQCHLGAGDSPCRVHGEDGLARAALAPADAPSPLTARSAEASRTLDCDHCGDVAIESALGLLWDGDGGHCMSCGYPGQVSGDSETPPYWVLSDDDDAHCARADCEDDPCVAARGPTPKEGT